MKEQGEKYSRPLRKIPLFSAPCMGEVGIEIKRHKIVPEGGSPADEALRRWHTVEFYRNPPLQTGRWRWRI